MYNCFVLQNNLQVFTSFHYVVTVFYLSLSLFISTFILLFLPTFLVSNEISIQSHFRWSTLWSNLFTVINEFFRWFSHFYRLFFPSRLTSCYSNVRFFLLHALISRQSFRTSEPPLLYRRSLPPPVISSFLPFPFFRLSSFYRRIRAEMVSLQPCSTFSFHLHNVPRRVLTRELMSLTKFPCTRPRLICTGIYIRCVNYSIFGVSLIIGVDIRDLFVNL